MSDRFKLAQLPRLVLHPGSTFATLSAEPPDAREVLTGVAVWLGLLPPAFAFVGMTGFGWRLGAVDPIYFPWPVTLGICILYFACLLFGFLSTAVIARWMAVTYGATSAVGAHFALLTIVGAPLSLGSIAHVFPHVFVNLLVLVPCLIWSMFLLYRGLPVVLKTTPEQGMLMASSIIGYLFVAFVSLLGISAFLWTRGIGPRLAI